MGKKSKVSSKLVGCGLAALLVLFLFVLIAGIATCLIKFCYWIFATYVFYGAVASGTIPAALGWIQSFFIWVGIAILKLLLFPNSKSE